MVDSPASVSSSGLPGWALVAVTLACTVYGQVVLKWQLEQVDRVPAAAVEKVVFLARMIFVNPWVLSAFAAAGVAALAWMATLVVYDLSVAYPFMSLSFVLVAAASAVFLGEAFTLGQGIALLLIIAALVIGTRL
jgi:hypothetical protein